MRSALYRFRRRYTSDSLKNLVESSAGDNGWEVWRRLQLACEPSTRVVRLYRSMVAARASNPAENRKLLVEMEEHATRVVELPGKELDINNTKSDAWYTKRRHPQTHCPVLVGQRRPD